MDPLSLIAEELCYKRKDSRSTINERNPFGELNLHRDSRKSGENFTRFILITLFKGIPSFY